MCATTFFDREMREFITITDVSINCCLKSISYSFDFLKRNFSIYLEDTNSSAFHINKLSRVLSVKELREDSIYSIQEFHEKNSDEKEIKM